MEKRHFIVLGRYICTLLRNAFDVSTFIKNRLDLTEKLRAFSYIIQAIILLVTCVSMKPHHEDVAAVKDSFKRMLENGVYKTDLFSDL